MVRKNPDGWKLRKPARRKGNCRGKQKRENKEAGDGIHSETEAHVSEEEKIARKDTKHGTKSGDFFLNSSSHVLIRFL